MEPESPLASRKQASPTRGFLFADLRDYTRFVEKHGAAAAADLLVRYRLIVRNAVAHSEGSEIKTEGDSFYVVFQAVSDAVLCGLAITADARAAALGPEAPISVGIGVHAGETVDTPDGFVGGAVNIAARVCAIARPGEVLVTDTVRALTQTVLPVSFEPRGRRRLKGVAESISLYSVTEGIVPHRRSRRVLAAAVALAALAALAAALFLFRPAGALPPGPWTVGVQVPLGDNRFRGQPMLNGVQLAVDEANATGGVGGSQLVLDVRDDDAKKAAADAQGLVDDPRVVADVGPSGSNDAESVIPITNRAGLLECSPSNTRPGLTKPGYGADKLRSANPDRNNYIRLATSDDIQGPAAASFAYRDQAARTALVIDDTDMGYEVAESFKASFESLGGTVVRRALNPGADPATVLEPLTSPPPSGTIGAVYFGGFTDTGGAAVRQAMVAAGFANIPFISWDGLMDGSGTDAGTFINTSGGSAAGAYTTTVSIAPVSGAFDGRYRDKFGVAPDEYSGAAYACTQVILAALAGVAPSAPSAESLREAVRAHAVDTTRRYDTVLGIVGFDANGDSIRQYVTFYRVEMGANGGAGDWVFLKQQDFSSAP